jgi:hypothetical protein
VTDHTINLCKVEDVILLKEKGKVYEFISLNAKPLMQKGVFRHALKYSLWNLDVGGKIEIKTPEHKSYEFSKNRIDYWQVSREVFKSIGSDVTCLECLPEKGTLIVQKKLERYENSGISFGVVFSGSVNEIPKLKASLKTIQETINFSSLTSYEVLVCGPTEHNPSDWINVFPDLNISYLEFDFTDIKRLLIGVKKNYILSKASFNVVVINHTRILFSKEFAKDIMSKKFDLCTSQVFGDYQGGRSKYLDIGLIGSYDLTRVNQARTLIAQRIISSYLYYLSSRVPYIDGGLTIFNKNVLPEEPYHRNVSWGEAEDIELAAIASEAGFLIDKFEDITAISSVVKFGKGSLIKRVYNQIFSYFARFF